MKPILEKKKNGSSNGESYFTRGRSSHKNGNKKGRTKVEGNLIQRYGDKKCYWCNKEGHFKRNFKKKIQDEKNKCQEGGEATVVSANNDFGDVLGTLKGKSQMDLGLKFHLSHVSKL